MSTLHSHTHCQVAQAETWQRVCLSNRTADRPTDDRNEQRRHNTGLAKVAVQYSADSFVVNQTLVLRINICGENRHIAKPCPLSATLSRQYKP